MSYVKPIIDLNKTLVVTVGLPRSGKSTWAKQQGVPIVNQDAIRLALHNERFISAAEALVKVYAVYMVRALFLTGHAVVVLDETCTTRARRDFWRTAGKWTTKFYCLSTAEAECLARAHDDEEIKPTIQRMAESYEPLGQDEQAYVPPADLEV